MNVKIPPWKLALTLVAATVLVGGVFYYMTELYETGEDFRVYPNEKKKLSGSVVVTLPTDDPVILEGAAAFGPATTTRDSDVGQYLPLLFTAGDPISDAARHFPDHRRVSLDDYGNDPSSVSVTVAGEFWTTVKTAVVVDNYECALWAAPVATLLDAPLIFEGEACRDFIDDEGVRSAVTVGDVGDLDIPVRELRSQWDVYSYIIELLEPRKSQPDYLLVANPYDLDYEDETMDIPALSLAGLALACQYSAAVITGDFSVNVSECYSLGYGLGEAGGGERGTDPDETTDEDELVLQSGINEKAVAIDNAIDETVAYINEKTGKNPSSVCLAGGLGALPHLYLKSPIWYEDVQQDEKGEEYLATDHYYGDLDVVLGPDNDIDNNYGHTKQELYSQELAVGRLVAANLQDACALAARSLSYWDMEYGRMPSAARANAVIVESLACGSADSGASTNQQWDFFTQGGMVAKAYTPRETSAGEGVAPGFPKGEVLLHMENSNGIIYDGHGYPDGWYYTWTSTHDNEKDYDRIGFEDVRSLDLYACPVFAGACLTSALDWNKCWSTSDNAQDPFTPDQFMSLAFLHAGAMCYVGSTEESWGSFFGALLDGQPDRWGFGAFDLATFFWDGIFKGETLGQALTTAKEKFYSLEWTEPDGRPFARVCILECVYYGDPAAENGNPGNDGYL